MMKHTHFRYYVKDMPSHIITDVFKMQPVKFKAVAYTISMYGDYGTGTNIRMSWKTVALESGVSRNTAMKVRDLLILNKLLIPTSKLKNNIEVYKFGEVVDYDTLGCSISDIKNEHNSISYLDIKKRSSESKDSSDTYISNLKESEIVSDIIIESFSNKYGYPQNYKRTAAAGPSNQNAQRGDGHPSRNNQYSPAIPRLPKVPFSGWSADWKYL